MSESALEDIIVEEGPVLEDVKYDLGLSVAKLFSGEENFFVSVDRVLLGSLYDFAVTTLEAHGYATNLENILAILESARVASRVRYRARGGGEQVKAMLPGLAVEFPKRGRTGPILEKFYETIGHYEARLATLEASKDRKDQASGKSRSDLERELKELEKRNLALEAEIQRMARRVNQHEVPPPPSTSAPSELPENFRLGTFRGIHGEKRTASIRIGKSSMQIPLSRMSRIPRDGDPCILRMAGGAVEEVCAMGAAREGLEVRLCRVLAVREDGVRLLDNERKRWEILAANDEEEQIFRQLERFDAVLLTLEESETVLTISTLAKDKGRDIFASFQDAQLTRSLAVQMASEARLVDGAEHEGDEEVA